MVLYVSASIAAAVVSCVELAFRTGRSPFGDVRNKALAWWSAVTLLDAAAALSVAAGLTVVDGLPPGSAETTRWGVVLTGATLGVLGPLALRSPIRRATVADNEQVPVGITYVYDAARIKALYALDERFAWLVRADVETFRRRLESAGVSSDSLTKDIRRHIEDHKGLSPEAADTVEARVSEALSMPDEKTCTTALIKIMRAHRFRALMDNLA